jgi:membrane protein YdbS with pleckstrin-like domain
MTAPDLEAPRLQRLDPNVVRLWRLTLTLRGLFLTAATLAVEAWLDPPLPLGTFTAVVALLAAGAAAILPRLRYRAWGYALRDADLYLRHGVLIRTTSIVPHARIQHVDTRHGPVDRWLGLAQVVVYTAGTRGAMVGIPGLAAGTAESLRDRLAALSGTGDAV